MRSALLLAALAASPFALAQGVVPPYQVGQVNPLPGLSAGPVPVSSVQQVNMVHLPSDPPNVFLCSMTTTGLPVANGGAGGSDLLTGRYDAVTDTFTPDNDAAALNTSGTEFGLMIHSSGRYAAFDFLPGPPQLAGRANLTSPWQLIGSISPLPSQSYYDPSLANVGGVPHLLHVLGTNIAMTPIDLNTGVLTGASTVIVYPANSGGTANSPSPIVDSSGELIGVSHHDLLGSDNDHYVSFDLDPNTPAVQLNDTASWTNNGGLVGGRFIDAEDTPGPYHALAIDTYMFTGGRAAVGAMMEIRSFVPPNTGANLFVSWTLIGPTFLPAGQAIPGIGGELGLSSIAVAILMPPHASLNGESLLPLVVPNNPALAGVIIPAQSVTLNANAGTMAFGNTAVLTIL